VATHPEAEQKVLAELAAAGLPVNGDMEAALRALEAGGPDMLQRLPYFNAVINEAMRMYPAGASASLRWEQPCPWLAR
jgi:cytochrome P450